MSPPASAVKPTAYGRPRTRRDGVPDLRMSAAGIFPETALKMSVTTHSETVEIGSTTALGIAFSLRWNTRPPGDVGRSETVPPNSLCCGPAFPRATTSLPSSSSAACAISCCHVGPGSLRRPDPRSVFPLTALPREARQSDRRPDLHGTPYTGGFARSPDRTLRDLQRTSPGR